MRIRLTALCVPTLLVSAVLLTGVSAARAVTVKVDYTYDGNNFFGAGNPSGATAGALARNAIEAAAGYFSAILTDTLALIQTPPTFTSPAGSSVTWHWTLEIQNPATGVAATLTDAIIPADEYRVYVGARNMTGSTLGIGGKGGATVNPTGSYFPADAVQVNTIDTNFKNAVFRRDEPVGTFASWGGYIAFDRDANWHYNHLTAPTTNDFYSVALHEMAHVLGFGTAAEWNSLAVGPQFQGIAAAAAYGSPPPLTAPTVDNPNRTHWASGTMSKVYGTNIAQEAAMDPELTVGNRKYFTSLDVGALIDIGWEATPPSYNPADFNVDGFVNHLDFTAWKIAYGPTGGADANGDSRSDGRDFLAWQQASGASMLPSTMASTAPVAEPATASLAAGALAAMLLARRMAAKLGSRG